MIHLLEQWPVSSSELYSRAEQVEAWVQSDTIKIKMMDALNDCQRERERGRERHNEVEAFYWSTTERGRHSTQLSNIKCRVKRVPLVKSSLVSLRVCMCVCPRDRKNNSWVTRAIVSTRLQLHSLMYLKPQVPNGEKMIDRERIKEKYKDTKRMRERRSTGEMRKKAKSYVNCNSLYYSYFIFAWWTIVSSPSSWPNECRW